MTQQTFRIPTAALPATKAYLSAMEELLRLNEHLHNQYTERMTAAAQKMSAARDLAVKTAASLLGVEIASDGAASIDTKYLLDCGVAFFQYADADETPKAIPPKENLS